jgi:hypothetical protein
VEISGNVIDSKIQTGTDKNGRPIAFILFRDGSASVAVTSKRRLRFVATTGFALTKLTWQQLTSLQGHIANLRSLPNEAPSLAKAQVCGCGTHLDLYSTDGDRIAEVRDQTEGRKTVNLLHDSGMIETVQERDMLLAQIDRSRLPLTARSSRDPMGGGNPDDELMGALLGALLGQPGVSQVGRSSPSPRNRGGFGPDGISELGRMLGEAGMDPMSRDAFVSMGSPRGRDPFADDDGFGG